ncbi:MAG: TolB family protein [Methanosarcinaceae archaeon]
MRNNGLNRILLRSIWIVVLSGCIVSCGVKLEIQDIGGTWSPNSNEIVFVCYNKERTGNKDFSFPALGPYDGVEGSKLMEICISNSLGTSRYKLTDNEVMDYDPSWSSDGEKIVFVSQREVKNGSHVYTVSKDGTNLQRITNKERGYFLPKWSYRGDIIAVIADFGGDIYLIKTDGTQHHQLTTIGGITSFDWSTTENKIVFNSLTESGWEVFMVDVDNKEIIRVTNNNIDDYQPAWSPNGEFIAYISEGDIRIVDTENGDSLKISNPNGSIQSFSWYPNGQIISYAIPDSSKENFFVENIYDNSVHVFALGSPYEFSSPSWSYSGQYLLYDKYEDRNGDGFYEAKIWVMDVDDKVQWSISPVGE